MKKSIGKMLMVLAAFLLAQVAVAADATLSVFAEGTTSATLLKQAGEEFYVDINLNNPGEGTNLTHIMAILKWNPAVLTFTEYKVPAAVADVPATGEYAVSDAIKAKGVLVVGLDGFFTNMSQVKGPFNGPIAQIGFQVAEGLDATTPINLQLSFDTDILEGVLTAAEINEVATNVVVPPVTDADGNEIDTTCEDATGEVVKLFNVSSAAESIEDWTLETSETIELGNALSYTNEKGGTYTAGGKVTAIDDANITVKVGGTEEAYTAAKYGTFTLSSSNNGSVIWDGKVTEVIGHNNLEFVIPFTATSNDDNAYTDTNTLTLTVKPANTLPVVTDFAIVTDGDYAMMETKKVKFTFTITDADDDAAEPVANSVKLNDETLAGTFANDNGVWSFTATDSLDQDLVAHTVTDKNADGVYVLAWNIAFDVTDDIATVTSTQSSGDDKADWILDVDREQTAPTSAGFTPAAPTTADDITAAYGDATDADGDEITYSVIWSNGNKTYTGETLPAAQTAKGEVWTPTIYATTSPYGKDVTTSVVGDDVTIGNTAPTLAAAAESIFIRKGEATSATVKFTITDADEADTFTIANAVGQRGGVTPYEGAVGREFEVTFNVLNPGVEFTDGSITVTVNDGDADSEAVTVAVSYRDNPPPVIEDGESAFTIDEVDADKQATTLALNVKASDSKEVAPYGIQSIAWTITDGEGSIVFGTETNKNNTAAADGNFPEEDEMGVVVKTNGYATLDGKDRAASADFKVKVTVTDAMGVATEKEFTVTVNDTDRPASAPNNCDVVYVGGNKTGATIQAHAQGAADPDGDEVSYVYELYVDDDLVETSEATAPGTDLTFTTALKKGQVPEVVVTAVSKPDYQGGVQVESDEYKSGKLTKIENTAPVITVPDGDGAVAIDEFVEGYNEADATLTIGADADVKFAYDDIDEDADVDEVTVTVDDEGLAGYATADIVDGKLVITREPNVNTVGLDELPYFKLVATDQDGAVAEAKFNLTINPINTKPVVTVSDIYVAPDEATFEETFAVTSFGLSADEADQTILNILDVALEDEVGLLAGYEIVTSEDGKSVIVRGTVNQDVEPGSEAIIKFKVQDNGGTPFEDTGDEITVKVSIGATPWYPDYELECEDDGHDAHQLVITPKEGGESITLIVDGGYLWADDYYEQGCQGLLPGDYTVVAYAWTVSDGASKTVCFNGEITVPEYPVPASASVSYEDGTITVNAPLASGYTLVIYKDGVEYKRISKKFVPDDGEALPTESFEYAFGEVGEYTATILGTNPKGDGPVSEPFDLTIIEEQVDVELKWPDDGVFSPDGTAIYLEEGKRTANVQFSWPVVAAAKEYILCVLNSADGKSIEQKLSDCSYEMALTLSGKKDSYNWYVVAVGEDGQEVTSKTLDFSLVQKTNGAVVYGVYVEEDGGNVLSFDMEGIDKVSKVDVQLAHIESKTVTWYYAITSKGSAASLDKEEGGLYATVTIPGATISKGDVAVIRFYYNDNTSDEYTVYIVK